LAFAAASARAFACASALARASSCKQRSKKDGQ
jgi:hypothetical protein